jgi:putative transposase
VRRFQHPGALYHAHTVGAGSTPIVLSDEDRQLWHNALGIVVDRFGLRLLAWCLMTTHWHLLVRTPHGNIADAMHWLNSVYAHGFNQRYRRRGHLFGKRYDAWVIQTERHLLNTASYIAWNPPKAGLCSSPGEYRWGSYTATVAGEETWPANAADEILALAGGREGLRKLVEDGRAVVPAHLL